MLQPKQGLFSLAKKKVPSSMTIGNVELMHECFPDHLGEHKGVFYRAVHENSKNGIRQINRGRR